jgi:AraC-like DNA-binding protein
MHGSAPPLRLHLLACHEGLFRRWNHDALARPYWRVYWNREPGWSVRWRGGSEELDPGRVLLIGPETVYAGRSTRPATHRYLHCTIDGLAAPTGMWAFPCDAVLAALLESLHGAAGGAEVAAAATLCLHLIARLPGGTLTAPVHGEAVRGALALLATADRPLGNAALAAAAGMHPNAFIRRFRVETGLSPQSWQSRRRIERACLALERSDDSIDDIAEAFGYCDRHHFTRAFTRWRGVGPAAYRRQALRG